MRRIFRWAPWACVVPLLWHGQAALALSLLDIIEMSKGGYSESEIGRVIEVTGARFEIDGVGLVALKQADVPDGLIDRMLDEGGVPPTEVSAITATEILDLHEAGLSEETILKFVRHRNVCAPLSEDGGELLEREEFSAEFMAGFADAVAACEKDRVARAPIEPLPENAYAGSAPAATDEGHGGAHPGYQTTYHYDQHYYERPRHDHYFDGHYHPSYVYSYYHYDPLRRIYPIYIFRDHREGRDHRNRRDRDRRRDRDGDRAERQADTPSDGRRGPGVRGGGSRLFDEPRPVMTARPGQSGGAGMPGQRPASEPVVPGGPLLRGPLVANPDGDTAQDTPGATTPEVAEALAPDGGMSATPEATTQRPAVVPTRASGPGRVVDVTAPAAVRQAIPVRRRVTAPDRVGPRTPVRAPAARPNTDATPRVAAPRPVVRSSATPRPVTVPRNTRPRAVAPTRGQRPASPRTVAPRTVAPRTVTPRPVAPRVSAPRVAAPRAVAPRPPASRPVAPRAMTPRAVAPRSAPRAAAPRAVAPRAVRPSARAPRAVAPRAPTPRAVAPRVAPRAVAPRPAPRRIPPPERRVER